MIGKEAGMAWRLWHLLNDLNDVLWECYEQQFQQLDEAEQENRLAIELDALDADDYPF